MNSMIDYIGSMITGGVIFVMMLSYYINVSATSVTQVFNSVAQEDVTSMAEILDHDFRKAGYGVTDTIAFPVADSSRVALRGDFDNDGTVDTVTYWLSSTQMPGTGNPLARTLYRRFGGQTVSFTTNPVTMFRLWYYDASGSPTSVSRDIRFARIALHMESKVTSGDEVPGVYWERIFKPQNTR